MYTKHAVWTGMPNEFDFFTLSFLIHIRSFTIQDYAVYVAHHMYSYRCIYIATLALVFSFIHSLIQSFFIISIRTKSFARMQ